MQIYVSKFKAPRNLTFKIQMNSKCTCRSKNKKTNVSLLPKIATKKKRLIENIGNISLKYEGNVVQLALEAALLKTQNYYVEKAKRKFTERGLQICENFTSRHTSEKYQKETHRKKGNCTYLYQCPEQEQYQYIYYILDDFLIFLFFCQRSLFLFYSVIARTKFTIAKIVDSVLARNKFVTMIELFMKNINILIIINNQKKNMQQMNIKITPSEIKENKEEDPDSDQSRQENNNSQSQDSEVDKADVLWKLIRNAAYLFAYFTISIKILGTIKQNKYKFIWNVYEYVKK